MKNREFGLKTEFGSSFEKGDFFPDMRAVELLTLTSSERAIVTKRMLQLIRKKTQFLAKKQLDVDGDPLVPRKFRGRVCDKDEWKKTPKDPMFGNLFEAPWLQIRMTSDESGELFFGRNVGIVASKHHFGGTDAFIFERNAKLFPDLMPGDPRLDELVTKEQAKLLRFYGWFNKIDVIMQNVKYGVALAYIKKWAKMRINFSMTKRPILGANAEMRDNMRDEILNSVHDKFKSSKYKNFWQ